MATLARYFCFSMNNLQRLRGYNCQLNWCEADPDVTQSEAGVIAKCQIVSECSSTQSEDGIWVVSQMGETCEPNGSQMWACGRRDTLRGSCLIRSTRRTVKLKLGHMNKYKSWVHMHVLAVDNWCRQIACTKLEAHTQMFTHIWQNVTLHTGL